MNRTTGVVSATVRLARVPYGPAQVALIPDTWKVGVALVLIAVLFALSHGDLRTILQRFFYPMCDDQAAVVTSTPVVQPDGQAAQGPYRGIWISQQELSQLPTNGAAWQALKAAADRDPGKPNISDQNENNDVNVLAKALVYARTGQATYRAQVVQNLMDAIGSERGGRTLAVSRNLVSYIISADLINLPADADKDARFRAWLQALQNEDLDKRSLRSTQNDRPNNWGTHAGASRVAVDLYLGDAADLERAAKVFQGYLGDTNAYNGFVYGEDLSWQCDPAHPVGINPRGCVREGHLIDGALPEEMRRGASIQWPPVKTGYAWEGLQGALVTAELLARAGYPAWQWQDQALLRAVNFLYSIDWTPENDDQGYVWLINHAYGTRFPAVVGAPPGKNIGWLDWTFSSNPAAHGINDSCH